MFYFIRKSKRKNLVPGGILEAKILPGIHSSIYWSDIESMLCKLGQQRQRRQLHKNNKSVSIDWSKVRHHLCHSQTASRRILKVTDAMPCLPRSWFHIFHTYLFGGAPLSCKGLSDWPGLQDGNNGKRNQRTILLIGTICHCRPDIVDPQTVAREVPNLPLCLSINRRSSSVRIPLVRIDRCCCTKLKLSMFANHVYHQLSVLIGSWHFRMWTNETGDDTHQVDGDMLQLTRPILWMDRMLRILTNWRATTRLNRSACLVFCDRNWRYSYKQQTDPLLLDMYGCVMLPVFDRQTPGNEAWMGALEQLIFKLLSFKGIIKFARLQLQLYCSMSQPDNEDGSGVKLKEEDDSE